MSADFCTDRIDVITNFAVIKNANWSIIVCPWQRSVMHDFICHIDGWMFELFIDAQPQ